MSRFLKASLQSLAPYTPGEQPRGQQFVKLNTNESPYPASPMVLSAVQAEVEKLNLYCDPTCQNVKELLAAQMDVTPDEIFLSNGSDEVLAIAFGGFCPNGVAFTDITYGFYKVYAQLWGLDTEIIPLDENFYLPPEKYYSLHKTIFVANPNAPTGIAYTRNQIEKIVLNNVDSLVVIDEAYVDFGAESAVSLTKKYDNLLVVGTFSKSRSLAGGRLGYAVGNKDLIADLEKLKYSFNPYNVNRMTQAAAAAVLKDKAYFEECRDRIVQTRTEALEELRKLGFEATDSLGNFVFVCHPSFSGEYLYTALRTEGVLVRWFNQPRIKNHLRITIGTQKQMDILLEKMRKIVG